LGESDWGVYNCQVIGEENYQFGNRTFYCGLVKTSYPFSPNIFRLQWYSDDGMIYSHINYGMQYRQDEMGHIIDSVYSFEDTRLSSIILAE
jgi:hypothetical protein